jgi:hypothetical protein
MFVVIDTFSVAPPLTEESKVVKFGDLELRLSVVEIEFAETPMAWSSVLELIADAIPEAMDANVSPAKTV